MKTTKLFLFVMMLMFIAACTKDGFIPGDSSLLSKENTLLKNGHCGQVFTVLPTGTDDTENLIEAFDNAKLTGPGSVVQLVKGVYNIGFIEIRDFNGSFRGLAKSKTRIQNIDNLPPSAPVYEANLLPSLLSFIGGEVNISRMTIATKDGPTCTDDPYYGILACLLVLSDYSGTYVPSNRFIKSVVENVDFIGGTNSVVNTFGTDHNVNMSVYVGGDEWALIPGDPYSSLNVIIKNCTFDHIAIGPDGWGLDEKSTFIIDNNIVRNSMYNLFIGANLGVKSYIRNNQFINASSGTYIDDSDYGLMNFQVLKKRSEFYMSENLFKGSAALYMHDTRRTIYPDEGLPQLFELRNNTFITNEGEMAIYSLNNVGAKIWNNNFQGAGNVGAMIDGDPSTGTYGENNCLVGNNFLNANYTDAAVYLGPLSMNCKVIGVSKDKVVDEGINNSVIGSRAHKGGHSPQYLNNVLRSGPKNFPMRRFN